MNITLVRKTNYTLVYIYIYVNVCMCVCVCVARFCWIHGTKGHLHSWNVDILLYVRICLYVRIESNLNNINNFEIWFAIVPVLPIHMNAKNEKTIDGGEPLTIL